MSLPPLPPLREVIATHGLAASKALGQNFLLDEQLLDRIARVPGPLAGETVYEVGPGPGGLTRALLRAGANVVAVERDRRCLPALAELAGSAPGRLTVIEADAMTIDERGIGAQHVAANLPYNVGTALLVRWLIAGAVARQAVTPAGSSTATTNDASWPPWWRSLTLMFQKEVAERIVAAPGTSAYGRLAVLAQLRASARLALPVHRSAFVPPPKVMSAVVHIVPAAAPEDVRVATLERVTAAAFGQRRKMLRQSLKAVPGAVEALAALDIDPERRAETLTVAEFTAIARVLDQPVLLRMREPR